jgi:hypothetical protein
MKKLPKTPFDRVKSLAGFATAILSGSILFLASVPPSLAAPKPNCVELYDRKKGWFLKPENAITAKNNCETTQKVLFTDYPTYLPTKYETCVPIGPGQEHRHKWNVGDLDVSSCN